MAYNSIRHLIVIFCNFKNILRTAEISQQNGNSGSNGVQPPQPQRLIEMYTNPWLSRPLNACLADACLAKGACVWSKWPGEKEKSSVWQWLISLDNIQLPNPSFS